MNKILSTKGFTLIEMIAVIAIMGVLFAVSIPSISKHRHNQDLRVATEDVMTTLSDARNRTITGKGKMQYGVKLSTSSLVLFSGAVYNPADTNNETVLLPSSVSLSPNLAGGSGDTILFERLTGSTANGGTVTITSTNDNGLYRVIDIIATGLASVR